MQFLQDGLEAYQADKALLKPTGFLKAVKLMNDTFPIVTNSYALKLCSNRKNFTKEFFQTVDFKAIGTILALERSFSAFLAYLTFSNKGVPESTSPLEVKNLYKLRKNGQVNEFRTYTSSLNQQILWELMSVTWSKDSNSIRKLHDFFIKIIHTTFGWRLLPQSDDPNFVCGPLLRANGVNELEQLDLLSNLVQHICMSVSKSQPILALFCYAHRLKIQGDEIWIEIETIQSFQFTGVFKSVCQFYEGRKDFLLFTLRPKTTDKVVCPLHITDSQTSTPSSGPVMSDNPYFNPHLLSPHHHTTSQSLFPEHTKLKSDRKRRARNKKENLKPDDFFTTSSDEVATPKKSRKAKRKSLHATSDKKIKSNPKIKHNLVSNNHSEKCNLPQGENSDDFSDEVNRSEVVVGRSKPSDAQRPIVHIPSQLTTSTQREANSQVCSYDALSTTPSQEYSPILKPINVANTRPKRTVRKIQKD